MVWEAGVKIEDLEVSLFIFFDILEDTVSSCVFSCCDWFCATMGSFVFSWHSGCSALVVF